MIVVDTSVWVQALRKGAFGGELARTIRAEAAFMPIPVRIELMLGWSQRQAKTLQYTLDSVFTLHPTDDTWETVHEWAHRAIQAGQRFGFADLLIGAIAAEHDAPVWSFDADFDRMEALGFVELYRP